MDLAAQYCPIRKNFEEQILILVDRLVWLTSRLKSFVGDDHQAFISARADCDDTKAEIAESRRDLRFHRSEHGC